MEPTRRNVNDIYQKIELTAGGMDNMLKKLAMASEINHSDLKIESIPFNEIIPEIKNNLPLLHNGHNIKVKWEIAEKISYEGDRRLIEMVFEYLLENAVRFHGGGPDEKPEIKIYIKENSEEVKISIFDNGQGISQEAISKVFDMFTVATDKTNGYGLGLYLVKKAVQKLNGSIQVKSEEHEFTKFEISLPKSGF